ncbi:hypothetical protein TgHK011_005965 [Trichoderma gracile]|nr:hypothetical protein TgHK011_005965 [Trichoderma gracile]
MLARITCATYLGTQASSACGTSSVPAAGNEECGEQVGEAERRSNLLRARIRTLGTATTSHTSSASNRKLRMRVQAQVATCMKPGTKQLLLSIVSAR